MHTALTIVSLITGLIYPVLLAWAIVLMARKRSADQLDKAVRLLKYATAFAVVALAANLLDTNWFSVGLRTFGLAVMVPTLWFASRTARTRRSVEWQATQRTAREFDLLIPDLTEKDR